ncbi:MAG: hypothetical protein ACO1RX_21915 [Candidatus Sericytochromatia bacterium]
MGNLHNVMSRHNPFTPGAPRGPVVPAVRAPEVLTAQQNARQTLQAAPKDIPIHPRVASGRDIANARELTQPSTVADFDNRLTQLGVAPLQQNAQALGNGTSFVGYLKKAGNFLVGKGNTAGEVHGISGLSAAYAANTKGGIADLSVGSDPSSRVNDALGVGTDHHNDKLDKAISGNFDNNEGAKAGAAIGGVVAAIGIYNSYQQLKGASARRELAKSLSDDAGVFDQVAQALNGPPPNPQQAATLLGPIHQKLVQQAQQPNLPPGMLQQIQQQAQTLQGQIDSLNDVNDPNHAATQQTLLNTLPADANAMRELSAIFKSEAKFARFEGALALGTNVNGFINAVFTGASAIAESGAFYNFASSLLIVTQAVSGIGMAVGGAYGMVKNFSEARTSHKRIQDVDTFMQTLAQQAPPANPSAVQRQEEIKDVAKLVRAENVSNRRHKIFNGVKNGLMMAGGIALTVGVLAGAAALAATPVGWALGGAAALMGIGYGIYRLVQKKRQKSTVSGLEQQHQRVQQEVQQRQANVAGLLPNEAAMQARTQRRGVVAADLAQAQQEQPVLQGRANRLGVVNHELAAAQQDQPQLQARADRLAVVNQDLATAQQDQPQLQGRANRLPQLVQQEQAAQLRLVALTQLELPRNQQDEAEFQTLSGDAQTPGSVQQIQGERAALAVIVQQEAARLALLNADVNTAGSVQQLTHEQHNLAPVVQQETARLTLLNADVNTAGSLLQLTQEQQTLTPLVNQHAARLGQLNADVNTPGSLLQLGQEHLQLQPTAQADAQGLQHITEFRELSSLQAQLETRLRQTSPQHAIRTLVEQLQEGNPDARNFAQNVLKISPAVVQNQHTDPVYLAELIKRKMGLVYG